MWPVPVALARLSQHERAGARADRLDDLAHDLAVVIDTEAGPARRISPDWIDEIADDYGLDDVDWGWVTRRALVLLDRQGRSVAVVPSEE